MEIKRPGTLLAALRYFDKETATAYVASIKWPTGPACPECGSVNVGEIKSRSRFQCREKGCRCQFSLTTGTIMEATHLKLDQWLAAVWMIANCRNGVSSCEIARTIGCKQQSAWHLLHRVRHLMQQDRSERIGQRMGVVESDWTYVGGSLKFMSYDRQERAKKMGRAYGNKVVVHAMKERRSGTIRASVIPSDSTAYVRKEISEGVADNAHVYTDAAHGYKWMDRSIYHHKSVNHSAMEYVRGTVHVNGCENFFNCLRRGLKGTYIAASPEHLPAYVDEQVYRFNIRNLSEWERFDKVMQLIVGKRLKYSVLTAGAVR